MTRATEPLYEEHRLILRALACARALCDAAEAAGRLDRDRAERLVDFIRTFADDYHHAREEHRLFPAMEARGVPRAGGPIAVMLYEHEVGREAVAGMVATLEEAAAGEAGPLAAFLRHGRDYVRLLLDHIAKEDGILYPIAEDVLPEADHADLLAAFAELDGGRHAGVRERYTAVVDALCAELGVVGQPAPPAFHCGGGSCHDELP